MLPVWHLMLKSVIRITRRVCEYVKFEYLY